MPIFMRDRIAVVVSPSIFATAILPWIAAYYLMPLMSTGGRDATMSGVLGIIVAGSFSVFGLVFFLFVWSIGMVAMMFPAMLPISLFYSKIVTRIEPHAKRSRVIGTPLLLLGYLSAYAALGVGSYLLVCAVLSAVMEIPVLSALSALTPALVLFAAALFQISALRRKMLSQCISPVGFFALHSHRGLAAVLGWG